MVSAETQKPSRVCTGHNHTQPMRGRPFAVTTTLVQLPPTCLQYSIPCCWPALLLAIQLQIQVLSWYSCSKQQKHWASITFHHMLRASGHVRHTASHLKQDLITADCIISRTSCNVTKIPLFGGPQPPRSIRFLSWHSKMMSALVLCCSAKRTLVLELITVCRRSADLHMAQPDVLESRKTRFLQARVLRPSC